MRIVVAALALITVWGGCGSGIAIAQSLDLQERCGVQAGKAFRQWKSEDEQESRRLNSPNTQILSADYQSHYNTQLNRCLMTVQMTRMDGSNTKWLSDANENRIYAFYLWMPDPKGVKKYWEVRPFSCELTPSIREKRLCSSEDEYNEFVATYMEQ